MGDETSVVPPQRQDCGEWGGRVDVEVDELSPGVWHARAKHVGWVLVVEGEEVTLVDTGYPGDRDRVIASLAKVGRSPADVAAIVLTHAHPDHLGSAEYFRSVQYKPVLVHEREVSNATGQRIEQVSIATLLSMVWRPDVAVWVRDLVALKAARAERLGAVDTFTTGVLDIPGRPVPVPTPGHTSGHSCFHLPERGALLVGDALTTDHALVHVPGPQLLPAFFNHDNEQALASLQTLSDLDADVVLPGHGPAFSGSPADAVAAAVAAASRQTGQPVRITYEAVIPLPPQEAFAFLTEPRNWPSFVSSMRSTSKEAGWEGIGGRAEMANTFMGRRVTSELEMTAWDPPREFGYVSRQPGAPSLHNRRVLDPVPGGTRLRGTTEAVLRSGLPGLLDRVQRQMLRRTYAAAMARLPQVARTSHESTRE
jgi:glyoxylase-like metal-dependent hydrolase (beta-lactamase superfamily II)